MILRLHCIKGCSLISCAERYSVTAFFPGLAESPEVQHVRNLPVMPHDGALPVARDLPCLKDAYESAFETLEAVLHLHEDDPQHAVFIPGGFLP